MMLSQRSSWAGVMGAVLIGMATLMVPTAWARGGGGSGSGGGGGHGGGGGNGGGGHGQGGGGGWGGGHHHHGGGWGGGYWGGSCWNNWGYGNSWNNGYWTNSYYRPFYTYPMQTAVTGSADSQSYIYTATSHLYWQANDAAWDMYQNYAGAPGYRSTYREMYKLLQTAKAISSNVQQSRSGPAGLRQDLMEAEAILSGLRQDVSQWTPASASGAAGLAAKLDRLAGTLGEVQQAAGLPVTANQPPSTVQAAPAASGFPSEAPRVTLAQ